MPQLTSLRLLGMDVPDNFNFLPANVQNVTIEDCSTKDSIIAFPPSVKRVLVKNLWKRRYDDGSDEMILLPPNRYSPLESEIEHIYGSSMTMLKITFSSKDCQDMDNFNPLPYRYEPDLVKIDYDQQRRSEGW